MTDHQRTTNPNRTTIDQVRMSYRTARGEWKNDTISVYTINRDDGLKTYLHTNDTKIMLLPHEVEQLRDALTQITD